MEIYLPIAELSVNPLEVIILGAIVGMTSGIFGVGGGFLLSPLLIFLGIPSAIAVGTGTNQLLATSLASVLNLGKKKMVDYAIGWYIVLGGVISSTLGSGIFALLKRIGQIDSVISVIYILFLGYIGFVMFRESINSSYNIDILSFTKYLKKYRTAHKPVKYSEELIEKLSYFERLNARLPMQRHFAVSNITLSIFMPIGLGAFTGLLSSLMGIGGGLIVVPAMVYILKMPPNIVVGTSLFQIIFISANTSFWQAALSQSVDGVLAWLLILGGVVGAQFGLKIGIKLPPEKMRLILSSVILLICLRLLYGLFITPADAWSIEIKL